MNTEKLEFNPYKILEVKGRKYLYMIENSGIFEIDPNLDFFLSMDNAENIPCTSDSVSLSVKEQAQFIKDMKAADIVKSNDSTRSINPVEDSSDINLNGITLMVSQMCNLRCRYCYGEAGEFNHTPGRMSKTIGLAAVDFLLKNSNSSSVLISFMGGEPLLNLELIKSIVSYCKSKTDRKFIFSVTTNGTLLNPETSRFLLDNHISTQISIDGDRNSHDMMRYFPNGEGSYDVLLKNTSYLRNIKYLTARATLSPGNLDYIKVFDHLYSMGFVDIPISPARNLLKSDTDIKLEYMHFQKYVDYFCKCVKNNEIDKAQKMTDIYLAFRKLQMTGVRKRGCGAFRNSVAINIDGKIYPCHRFVGIEKFCTGSITGNYKLKAKSTTENSKCKSCWIKNLCLGGCAYENFMSTANINEPSDEFCNHMHYMYHKLLELYIEIKMRI